MENKDFNLTEEPENFDLVTADDNYKSQNFKKKKRGIAGFFQKIGTAISGWWKPMKTWKKVLFCIGVAFLAIAVALGIFVATILDYNYDAEFDKLTDEELGISHTIDKKVVNVALFGVDTRSIDTFTGNSDSIMILSINTKTKKVKIVSIMRDSLVPIEKENGKIEYAKINAAYNMGGPQLAVKTLNQNFGLDIREYATVNFYSMSKIIDAVGGIDAELTRVEVTSTSKDALNGLIRRQCKKMGKNPEKYYVKNWGKQHLNGIQAVAYSRIRKFANVWGTNNDHGRTDRQRYVMEQLFNKAVKLPESKYLSLITALSDKNTTKTSLNPDDILALAKSVLLHSPKFEQSRVPMTEFEMRGISVKGYGSCVYYDLDYAKKLIYAFFYDDIHPEKYIEKNGVTKNDWYGQLMGNSTQDSGGTSSKPSDGSGTISKPSVDEPPIESTPQTPDTSSGSQTTTEPEGTTSGDSGTTSEDSPTDTPPESSESSTGSEDTGSSEDSGTGSTPTESTPTVPDTSSDVSSAG